MSAMEPVDLTRRLGSLAGTDLLVEGRSIDDDREFVFVRLGSVRDGSVATRSLFDEYARHPYQGGFRLPLERWFAENWLMDADLHEGSFSADATLGDYALTLTRPVVAYRGTIHWPLLASRWPVFALGAAAAVCLATAYFVGWMLLPGILLGIAAYTAATRRRHPQTPRIGEERRFAFELPPVPDAVNPTPAERVTVVEAEYGRLLADIVYRIENSALFDAAVAETTRFQVSLITWESVGDEAAATEVEEAFFAARHKAEQLGLGHLPETARDKAGRAVKAAETALAAEHPGEREAAGRSAAQLLASLALYYLPVVDPAVPSLIGARRAIDTGTPVPTSD